ncbi:hypothetical protein DL95DRAFT_184677 [Leptodontidium sp. 2 PMI_412]|nr:hypothetical protein BKA61DRAFT_52393 [Leptodontidium sp. MPI-SDFR-AT-0119]KAH9211888.1 hypothetical protein DL95DRAFT_184677 [Leptodontidium sp. 2 PMI_412]
MSIRRPYIERDSRGRERLVLGGRSPSHRRASSIGEPTTHQLLVEAEAREQTLISEVSSLQTRLSMAQRDQWHLQNLRTEHQRVVNEHYQCRNMGAQLDAQVREVRRIEDLLVEEEERNAKLEHKNEKLEEKVRLLKRGSAGAEGYQRRYEEKLLEVEVLRQRMLEKDELVRLAETRIAEKNRTIVYLKSYLRTHGFRVED